MTPEQAAKVAAYARFREDQIQAARDEALSSMKQALEFSPVALKAAKRWSRPDYPTLKVREAMDQGYWVQWVRNTYDDIAHHRVDSCEHMVVEVERLAYPRWPIAPGVVFGHAPLRLWCLDCAALEMVGHVQRTDGIEVCALCDQPANDSRPASAVAFLYWVYASLCDSCWEASQP